MAEVHARYDEAIQLQQEGKLDEAIARLEQIVADEPQFALAHTALSVFYSRQGRHDEALEHARKVCDLEADDPFSFMSMSIICQKAGLTTDAEMAMSMAMEKQWEARRKG